jgi:hypothetical protein
MVRLGLHALLGNGNYSPFGAMGDKDAPQK